MNNRAQNTVHIPNGNVTLNVQISSPDKSESIILLHGGPGVPDDMIALVNFLKNKYQVIYFEQRGVGLSKCQKCTFTMSDYISDIDAIADKLNLDSFHLFGHSWGGLYAQIYAEKRPEKIKSLFLCSPSSGTNKTWKTTEREVMRFNKRNCYAGEWTKMGWNSLLGMLGSNKAYRKLFNQVLRNYHKNHMPLKIEEGFFNKIFAKPINKTRKEIAHYPPLKRIINSNYPIIITYGNNDIYGESKKEVIDRFPDAKVSTIEKCGHIPWLHNPTSFEMILSEFYK